MPHTACYITNYKVSNTVYYILCRFRLQLFKSTVRFLSYLSHVTVCLCDLLHGHIGFTVHRREVSLADLMRCSVKPLKVYLKGRFIRN